MDDFSKRFTPEFWDSIRRTSAIMNSLQQSVLAANRFWQDNFKLFSPALMESVERISRLTRSIPNTLGPTLAEFSQISERINRSFLPAAHEITLMQNKWREAFQPLFVTLDRVAPTETQLFSLAETLQIQIALLNEMGSEDQPDVGIADEEAAANDVNEVLSQPDNWEKILVQYFDTMINKAAVQHTSTCVRIPASFNRLLRSVPIIAPQQQATRRRTKKSKYCRSERC